MAQGILFLCVVDPDRLYPVLLCSYILGKLTVGGILSSFGKELLACGRTEILWLRVSSRLALCSGQQGQPAFGYVSITGWMLHWC